MSKQTDPSTPDTRGASPLSRRNLFAGAGTAGALAAAAAVLPLGKPTAPVVAAATPAAGGGYQLSEHVKRYYETARV